MSEEDKKKMNYYYGGKEKSAEEVKKGQANIIPYTVWDIQQDFNRMMNRFERDFEDFWGTSTRIGRDMTKRARSSMPTLGGTMPSIDIEDQGKNYRLTVDMPGFKKEDVQIELEEDEVTINAKRSQAEDEQNKNYVRHERSAQTYYRRIHLPEPIRSDQSNAKLNNGILEIMLPKKEPKETKKLTVM